MKKHPIWYLIIGISILIIPTLIYLIFLIPKMSVEYNILMASGGIIGGAGFYTSSIIPAGIKNKSLYKLAANSFTIMCVITLVNKFIMQLIGLVSTFILSFIIYKILKERWKNARREKERREFADEIARNVAQITK